MASFTFVKISCFYCVASVIPTLWAFKAIRPAYFKKMFSTSFFTVEFGRVSKMSNFTLQFIEQQKKDTLK